MPVPMDDHETAHYAVAYSTEHPMDYEQAARDAGFDDPKYDPVTCDWKLHWEDRLGQNRSIMNTSWSGCEGNSARREDYMMSVSMGADWDRTKENTVPADLAVVRMRRRVLQAIRNVQKGEAPPSVNIADMTRVSTYDGEIRTGQNWQALASDHRHLAAE
jgi:phthalate 4,5-dioxygenase oxygenase subunit